jgi:hypothetical protein
MERSWGRHNTNIQEVAHATTQKKQYQYKPRWQIYFNLPAAIEEAKFHDSILHWARIGINPFFCRALIKPGVPTIYRRRENFAAFYKTVFLAGEYPLHSFRNSVYNLLQHEPGKFISTS